MPSIFTIKKLEIETATILNGQTKSDVIDLHGRVLAGVIIPAAITGASLSFEVSFDNVTFYPYYNTLNAAVSFNITVSTYVGIDVADFAPIRYLKVVSASAEAADRDIKLVFRGGL